jgi:hypothetical protein
LKSETDFNAPLRPRLLAVSAALLEALYDPGAVAVLATLGPADMRAGGARIPGTSYEVEPATAARVMRALLALRGVQADDLVAALAQADQVARYAVLAGQPPPTLAALYAHCTRDLAIAGGGGMEAALKALLAAAEKIFTPTQSRRIAMLCQLLREEPARLDTLPVQQFVAGLVRNSP